MRQFHMSVTGFFWRLSSSRPRSIYCAFIVGLLACIATSGGLLLDAAVAPVTSMMRLGDADAPTVEPRPARTASAVLEGDAWLENLKTKWRQSDSGRASNLGGSRGGLDAFTIPFFGAPATSGGDYDQTPKRSSLKTHRTMCVRLCDGYYFPISYSTTSSRFEDDERACERSCASPAKLYVYRNPGEEPEDMVSLKGEAYSKLPTAFQFREKFNQACRCNPHPWEEAAMDRHRKYAEEANRKQLAQQAATQKKSVSRGGKAARNAAATTVIRSGNETTAAAAGNSAMPAMGQQTAPATPSPQASPVVAAQESLPASATASARQPSDTANLETANVAPAKGRHAQRRSRTADAAAIGKARSGTPQRLALPQSETPPAARIQRVADWRGKAFTAQR